MMIHQQQNPQDNQDIFFSARCRPTELLRLWDNCRSHGTSKRRDLSLDSTHNPSVAWLSLPEVIRLCWFVGWHWKNNEIFTRSAQVASSPTAAWGFPEFHNMLRMLRFDSNRLRVECPEAQRVLGFDMFWLFIPSDVRGCQFHESKFFWVSSPIGQYQMAAWMGIW